MGLCPDEKIHKVTCPRDDSHLTVEFKGHYLIIPTIKFFDADRNFRVNNVGEQGEVVETGFEYNSSENPCFLTIEELRDELRREVY